MRILALCLVAGCVAPGGPDSEPDLPDAARAVDAPALESAPPAAARCLPARGAQRLPARVSVIGSASAPLTSADRPVFTADLFNLFKSHCGACHVETKLGNFQAKLRTFPDDITSKVLDAIRSDDTAKVMPPPAAGGRPFSRRAEGDPIRQLVGELERWMGAGKPAEVFYLPGETRQAPPSYLMTPAIAKGLTSIGDCIAETLMVATDRSKMNDLDALFSNATELPESLADTDLFTLDSEALARSGVIAYAPAYPLWSDDAGKLRHVRLPAGQSVRFDKATQRFEIPAHTRFYKTFLKKVIDRDGNESYRKIETRLIVSRPDAAGALFGTYLWNDEETEAHLLRDPLRNGRPFRDRLITYVVDEQKADRIRASMPRNLTYALEVENPGLLRRYAIPGSERCVHCHMGGSSFILGFTPLQLARRPAGEGGVIEAALQDDVNQLARLVDYRLISGLTSAADVLRLEDSQGMRKPRNEYELKAQGYLVGNCAHCHNPRGFPSTKNPELRELLDFLPSAEGGIFQFPLDRVSPRLKRGIEQDIPIPYITPSLREFPVDGAANDTNWRPKWIDCKERPEFCGGKSSGILHVDAPWRSLIYRNVETPFAYADDYAIFPHMPMDTPGFDCRAPRLLAEWMVSIPAARKSGGDEDAVPDGKRPDKTDRNPQPYLEVKPGDAGYDAALAAARQRLNTYRGGRRYLHCPVGEDIVDRAVLQAQKTGVPPDYFVPRDEDVFAKDDPRKGIFPMDNVPERSHWVVTDLTEAPGDWYPRRPDWAEVLADPGATDVVVRKLQAVRVTDELRALALGEVPFGLWVQKPGCDLSGLPKAGDYAGDRRPAWMAKAKPDAAAPVYTQSPGAAVFEMICINCHGPQADSKGLQADAIMMMTGGDARVANLRDGLLGPSETPEANRRRVFAAKAGPDASAEDWAARYLAWMALGGTQRSLPAPILNIVGTTRVLGEARNARQFGAPSGTPNMLRVAQELCRHVLPALPNQPVELGPAFFRDGTLDWGEATALIDRNGDAELWQRLCSFGNRAVVRVPYVSRWTAETRLLLDARESLYFADAYPAGAPVLDHRGRIATGVTSENLMPLCVRRPSDAEQAALARKFVDEHPVAGGTVLPFCPDEIFANTDGKPKWKLASVYDLDSGKTDLVDAQDWATRGAINAGMSVFLYLDQIEKGRLPKPRHNQCEALR